jgi:hypothetical protein
VTTALQAAAAAYAIEQIHVLADQLRQSWAWLVELAEPGPATPAAAAAETDDRAERLEADAHEARAYRQHNLRHGLSALPPSPAPVRIGIVDTQIHIDQLVNLAAARLAAAGHRASYRIPVADARAYGERRRHSPGVPALLDWITGDEIRIGLGHTGRDGILRLQLGAIATVRDPQLAADVEQLLARAARTAAAAAGDVDDPGEQLLDPDTNRPARCPACHRRSLSRSSTGLIRCVSQSCRCTGNAEPGHDECGCRRTDKRVDLAHVWTRGNEHQLWAAIDSARTTGDHRGVGRGATGHGGWQSRDMAGQQ